MSDRSFARFVVGPFALSIAACSGASDNARLGPPCPETNAASAAPAPIAAPKLTLHGDEGMWLLNDFPSERVKELHGFAPDQKWLDHVRRSSVRLTVGCSGSFVSPSGLVMTNHHCAHECIQQLSTKTKDFVASGFYAKTPKDEVKCPGAEIDDLVEIKDVTADMNAATKGLSGQAYSDAQRAEKNKLEKECAPDSAIRCDVVTLYHGGRDHLYKYKRYQDVRLVFAPELAIAFFGGDPDTFNFPRYDLDVSFLRVYEHDQPAKIDDYFAWSKDGAKAGDVTFVSGHPGGTSRGLTVAELEYQRDVFLPDHLAELAEMRGLLTEYGATGAEAARVSGDDLFGIENSIKAYKGEREALTNGSFFEALVADENALRAYVQSKPELASSVGGAWDAIAAAQKTLRRIRPRYRELEQRTFGSDLLRYARWIVRAGVESKKPNADRLREYSDAQLPALRAEVLSEAPFYPDYEILKLTHGLTKLREVLGADDPVVKKVLGQKSPKELAAELVKKSKLGDPKVRKALLVGGVAAVDASGDPMIALAKLVDGDARAVRKIYEDDVQSVEQRSGELIAKVRFDAYGTAAYPDATFTLRLAFGEVAGWNEDGKAVPPFTKIGGAFERATGRDPFALPKSWLDSKSKLDMNVPFDMSLTNDVVGGNSGSPVLNKDAEIVGLIFDGNIHSLGGEYGYDPTLNRSIAVTSTALTHALEKVYGADRILAELKR
jgi:hypothetical protein